MEIMISMLGEDEEIKMLPEIQKLGSGIELGSYALQGINSPRDWEIRYQKHKTAAKSFMGKTAVHGPLIGIEFAHQDYLLRAAIEKRIDMIFDVAKQLPTTRVVLHTGYTLETKSLGLEEKWYKRNVEYWKHEIERWEEAGIEIVLENVVESSPDLITSLVTEVNNSYLGLCLDIGHVHYFSKESLPTWIMKMGKMLKHVHVHDNDGKADRHWSIGRGNIDFEEFYKAIEENAPQVTLSLEVVATMEKNMGDLKKMKERIMKGKETT